MAWLFWIGIAVVLVVVYGSWLANRIDRLRLRMEATGASLDVALTRRAAACREVVGPVADAAAVALAATPEDRELAESALTRAVRVAWEDPWTAEVRTGVVTATERVHLARQFHNAAITALQRLRRRRLVRVLHLAGAAPTDYVEIDDRLPEG